MKIFSDLKKTIKSWSSHDPFVQSAAAAYYAVFSLPGLLIIIIAIGALLFDPQHVRSHVYGQIESIIGSNAAETMAKVVAKTRADGGSFWAMITGIATLLFGATGLFVQLQRSLNRIWDLEAKKSRSLVKFLRTRATSLGIIIAIGFVLLISLAITALLTALHNWLATQIPSYFLYLLYVVNLTFTFTVVVMIFTIIFKILPDAFIKWKEALRGGILSAVLFKIGEFALNFYFGITEPASAFGAAGSIVLLMLWVSYSCMILFMGAEYTKIYAERSRGSAIKPKDIAKKKVVPG